MGISRYIAKFGEGDITLAMEGALSGKEHSSACAYFSHIRTLQLFHRVAIALWWGNACLWLHRQPTLSPTVDGLV